VRFYAPTTGSPTCSPPGLKECRSVNVAGRRIGRTIRRRLAIHRGKGLGVGTSDEESEEPTPATYSGVKRFLAIGAGVVLVGVGIIGIFVPGLPATVWFLMASYLFARSSERLHTRLRGSRMAGGLLRDWEDHRAIRRQTKTRAITLVIIFSSISIAFAPIPSASKFGIALLAVTGVTVIGRLTVLPADA
jgi:uncharacterized protein